jgi:hypothetical protein
MTEEKTTMENSSENTKAIRILSSSELDAVSGGVKGNNPPPTSEGGSGVGGGTVGGTAAGPGSDGHYRGEGGCNHPLTPM